MFIVWGKKVVYRRLGYVADFCPLCREPRAFEVRRVGLASHVYYVSFGEGRLAGHERTCRSCGAVLRADPARYAAVSPAEQPLESLVAQTFPGLRQALKDRLALEERIRADPAAVSPEERRALVREPFLLLSPKVERRFATTHLDKETGLALVAALALCVLGPALAARAWPNAAGEAFVACLALAAALVVWQVAGSSRRFLSRSVIPALTTALRPLRPGEQELRAALEELKQQGQKLGKKLRLSDLQAELQAPQASPGSPRPNRLVR